MTWGVVVKDESPSERIVVAGPNPSSPLKLCVVVWLQPLDWFVRSHVGLHITCSVDELASQANQANMRGLAFPLTPQVPEAILSPATTNDDIPIDPALHSPIVQVRFYYDLAQSVLIVLDLGFTPTATPGAPIYPATPSR